MKKIEKSLGGATGPQSFVHKVNGIFGQNFQILISGPQKSTRLAKLKSMCNDISNFVKTWVSTKLKFMVDWNNKKCFKSDSGSVALKNNTWGIPRNISPGTQNLYLIELNCQYCRRLSAIVYIQLLKSYVIVIIPFRHCTIFSSWTSESNYGWEYFGCSSNCLAPNVTIFTKMQFSGKRINIFTIFFGIYFLDINHTMITYF